MPKQAIENIRAELREMDEMDRRVPSGVADIVTSIRADVDAVKGVRLGGV